MVEGELHFYKTHIAKNHSYIEKELSYWIANSNNKEGKEKRNKKGKKKRRKKNEQKKETEKRNIVIRYSIIFSLVFHKTDNYN